MVTPCSIITVGWIEHSPNTGVFPTKESACDYTMIILCFIAGRTQNCKLLRVVSVGDAVYVRMVNIRFVNSRDDLCSALLKTLCYVDFRWQFK